MTLKQIRNSFSALLTTLLVVGGLSTNTFAAATNDALSVEVRKEVTRLLNDDKFMAPILERGINNFIINQQAKADANKQQDRTKKMKNVRPVAADYDHIYGDPKAPFSLIEYSDFECPFCKRFHLAAKAFIDGNKGQVNWIYRHFPLSFHNPGAQKEAEASECASAQGGNEAFWKYTDLIYQRTTAGGTGFPIEQLTPLAKEIGLDAKLFETCLTSGQMADRVEKDFINGGASGITGTPGNILINNKTGKSQFLNGAVPLQRLNAALKQLSQE